MKERSYHQIGISPPKTKWKKGKKGNKEKREISDPLHPQVKLGYLLSHVTQMILSRSVLQCVAVCYSVVHCTYFLRDNQQTDQKCFFRKQTHCNALQHNGKSCNTLQSKVLFSQICFEICPEYPVWCVCAGGCLIKFN